MRKSLSGARQAQARLPLAYQAKPARGASITGPPGGVDSGWGTPLPLRWPPRGGAALPRGGIMAALPGRLPLIEPMLAAPARAVPGNEAEWRAEAKWDGARVLAYVSGGTVVLRGRSGGDVTGSYPEVAAALGRAAGTRTVVLD